MSHFKLIITTLLLSLFLNLQAKAETANLPTKKFSSLNFSNISLSYFSWTEKLILTQGGKTDHANCNLLGNSLSFEWEHYYEPRFGFTLQGFLMIGVADAGGTQNTLVYNKTNEHWTGGGTSAQFAYRFSKSVITSIGPILIYRNLKFSDDPSGVIVDSGSSTRVGATVDLRMRLSDHLEVRQEIGALDAIASTYWSVGVGYKF